jgi:hypothetical protein
MRADVRAVLQRQLDRLTEGDKPQDKARFAEGYWRSVRSWDERLAKDSESALRDLQQAHLARILVTEHPGSPQYAQAVREDFEHRTRESFDRPLDCTASLQPALPRFK